MDSAQNVYDLIKERAKAMVNIIHCSACVRVTAGPGWEDGMVSPETVCCFRLTWTAEGRPVSGPWIGWN